MLEENQENVNRYSATLTTSLERPKYGKMIVCCDQNYHVSLGPDYLFFVPTFIVISVVSVVVIRLVIINSQNLFYGLTSIVICGGTIIAYFAVGISNPGVVTEETSLGREEEEMAESLQNKQIKRICRVCGFRVKPKTYHCRVCDVCVEGYDHHCPWTSKCIGRGNIIRFYVFLLMMLIFMIYVCLSFGTMMSPQSHSKHL